MEENKVMEEKEKISQVDLLTLEIAKQKVAIGVANAKAVVAEQEKANAEYKNLVMQIFMKYNLTSKDSLSEDGTINRNSNE